MSTTPTGPTGPVAGIADLGPINRRKEHRAWYFYDWANSAFATTIAGVLFAPYLISVAEEAAVDNRISVLGISVAPGSLPSYLISFSTIVSALLLPVIGAWADRTARKKQLLAGFAWSGAAVAALLFLVTGDNWQLGAVVFLVANLLFGASLVINDSILVAISNEDERDTVSSRGWAAGYAGGGLLLAINFVMLSVMDDQALAARLAMLSAAIWWAGFTFIPFLGLRNREPVHVAQVEGGLLRQSFGQLATTLRHVRGYKVTLTFLLAYLFFNDGIQTVIASASTYGVKELGFEESTVLASYLLVQFVAVFGALGFGRLAVRFSAKPVILGGIVLWMVIVTVALVVPEKQIVPFLLLGAGIGLVLGGTQALARSYYSMLIPRGFEAEYFSFYHAMERGTSWFGTLVFGLVFQLTDSYRPSIFALIGFFVIGGLLLLKVDTERGIREAGNTPPAIA
jgi:UMF1 family MFS transporter